jgi:glutamyl-tRNA reductase
VQLILLGINHRSADLDLRERFAMNADSLAATLNTLSANALIEELVILSTCNRTEIYALTEHLSETRERLASYCCQQADIAREAFEAVAYTAYNKFASQHLFQVSAGLDSMVFGEYEILKQVKEALSEAQLAEACGPVLQQLFIAAIRAGKRVRTETPIGQGASSVGALAARLIRASAAELGHAPRILLIGTGKIGAVVLKNLENSGYPITLCNRSPARAQQMAGDFGLNALLPFEALTDSLSEFDVILSCTAAPHYLIDTTTATGLSGRSVLLIDLSVPRNLDPRLAEIPGLRYYDMDRLQHLVEQSQESRKAYQDLAETILADEMSKFLEWFNTRDLQPTIQALYTLFHEIRQQEIERGLKKYQGDVPAEVHDLLERVTRAINQKILHYPVVQLKLERQPELRAQYAHALSTLFQLNAQDGIDRYVQTAPPRQKSALHHE